MLITNHVVSGAIIGSVAPGPSSAFVAGLASHFALDSLPHWGERRIFLQVAVVDGLVGLAAMGALARLAPASRRGRVVAGMLGACAPDADKPSTLFFGRSPYPRVVDDWHISIQNESPRRLPQEVVVAGLGALVARRLLRR
ncbi:hypothetical protein [Nocardioides acrostichi]|uniref:Uncharacterized protein n=1 Tax=Nocardioides acrostichi TaxID=2784339 RepID=A0A930V236_9ACTN|nr:hypothetical protein [Nocardioides acrostichi]MBF4161794.1 hypothetical protein [Nocardioides acrostichi]